MIAEALWVALVGVGVVLILIKDLTHARAHPVLWRLAALSLAAAGTVAAGGWLGHWFRDTVTWGVHVGQGASKSAIGTAAVIGIAIGLISLVWLAALFLPNNVFGLELTDAAIVLGHFLPSLAVTIPGPVGEWLRTDVWPALAQPMIDGVTRLFGG